MYKDGHCEDLKENKKYEKETEVSTLDLSSQDLVTLPDDFLLLDINRLKDLTVDYNDLCKLPDEINCLFNLTKLSVCGNNITELPNQIKLINLEELLMDENCLVSLPDSFGNLIKLKKLSLIGNKLRTFPNSFGELHMLQELYADENDLKTVAFSFENLKCLEILEASNNKLKTLSDNIGCAIKLRILNLNFNQLTMLPESISDLTVVEILDISNNLLVELPERFDSSERLIKFMAENNNLKFLPNWCTHIQQLEELYLSDNAITNELFNDKFCESAVNLRILEAGANYMESISDKFGLLTKLEQVHFGSTIPELERSHFQNGNWMTRLPDSFCELKHLVKANLNENQFHSLPDYFGALQALTWLDLGQNMLRHLPNTFCELKNLEFLQLSKNQIEELPEDIGNLQKLIELRMDNNQLKEVPISLGSIKCLQALDLFCNKLDALPDVIFQLKKLVRLDLDENNFKMSLEEVPKITPGVNYPKRDPSLKNNWRGRNRISDVDDGKVIVFEQTENCEDKPVEEEWNYQALRNAMHKGMSFWRSHTDENETRPVIDSDETKYNTEPTTANVEGGSNDKEFITDGSRCDPDVEDWDEEIKVNAEYKSVLLTCNQRKDKNSITNIDDFQKTVNRYPPAKQAYSSTASYESLVYAKNRANCVAVEQLNNDMSCFALVKGQFDDAN